jgi:hypothetical protein
MTMIFMASRLGTPAEEAEPETFDYYIGPSGSDSNDGLTTGTPWALTAINDSAKRLLYRGKRVGFLDGTYNVSGVTTKTGGQSSLFEAQGGTVSAPTIFEAVNHRQWVIQANSGASYPHIDCPILGDYDSQLGYLHIIGLKLTGGGSKGIFLGGVSLPRIPGYVITDCEFTGFDCRGVAGGGNYSMVELHHITGHIVRDNYFHDNIGEDLGSSDHFAGCQNFNVTNGLYEFNTFVSSGGLYGKNDGIHGNTIRNNFIDVTGMGDNSNGAIADWAGSAETGNVTRIYNNICIGSYLNDLRKSDGGTGGYSNVEIYNNIFSTIVSVVHDPGVSFAVIMRYAAGKVKFFNNICMELGTGDHAFVCLNVDAPAVFDYNLYFRASGTYRWATFPSQTDNNRTGYTTFASHKTSYNIAVDTNGISGSDPQFVGSGTRAAFYQLQGGSPAINAGKSDGTSGGATVDIGAWGNGATAIGHRW